MKLLILLFLCALSAARVHAVTLEWDPNTEPNLAGYKVYRGTASRQYVPIGTNYLPGISNLILAASGLGTNLTPTVFIVTSLANGTNFFAVTAFDTDGFESDYSDEVFLVWTNRPAKVMGLRLSSLVVQSAPAVTGPWSLESVLADVDVSDGSRFLRLAISAPPPPAMPALKRLQPTSGSKTGKLPLIIPKRPVQGLPFPG